jgi:hypothetical protein
LSVTLALSLGLLLAALAVPAGAATSGPETVGRDGKQSLRIWAYFDGDTPITGARVRVFAGGRELRERSGPGPVRTLSGGSGFLQFRSLPPRLRIVVSGGRAGGRPVRGSLKAKVRGVTDGELVDVNPVTTVADAWAHAEKGRSHRRARNVIERTLGIRRIFDDDDLYATDRWFDGDRFHRWTLEQGSVGAGARALVDHIDEPGFDRRVFRDSDDGGPSARVAANYGGELTKTLLGNLIDSAGGAINASGLGSFGLGAALAFGKLLINLAIDAAFPEEVKVSEAEKQAKLANVKLDKISTQIVELKGQIDTQFFKLQVAKTQSIINDTEAAQKDLRDATATAERMLKPGVTKQKFAEEETHYNTALSRFLTLAHKLDTGHAIDNLHRDLVAEQQGGTVDPANPYGPAPNNPVTVPPLLSGIRAEVGKQRFFTSESSKTIRDFFDYYEWWQGRLAVVLTEYHMLGGRCALTTSDPTCKYTPPLPNPNSTPPPDRISAIQGVEEIQNNIAKQGEALPPKVLDPRVIIDTRTKRMWLLEPTWRGNPEILQSGLGGGCIEQKGDECRADLTNPGQVFPDLATIFLATPGGPQAKNYATPWIIPKASDLRDLFAGSGEPTPADCENQPACVPNEPYDRLKKLGVRYKGEPLKGNPDFWLASDFYLKIERSFGGNRSVTGIKAAYFKLVPRASKETVTSVNLGSGTCGLSAGFPTIPTCSSWNRNFGAFILWYRGLIGDAEVGDYWCRPGADGKVSKPSWNASQC